MKQLIALVAFAFVSTSFAADAPKKDTKAKTTVTKKADAPKKDLGKKPTPKKKAAEPKK